MTVENQNQMETEKLDAPMNGRSNLDELNSDCPTITLRKHATSKGDPCDNAKSCRHFRHARSARNRGRRNRFPKI